MRYNSRPMTNDELRMTNGRSHRVRVLAVTAVAVGSLLLSGCAILLTHTDAFQTGQIMEPGQAEIGIHTYATVPAGASIGIADADGWETRLSFGRIGNHPLALEASGTRRILTKDPWQMSAGVGFEAMSPDREIAFAGLRDLATMMALRRVIVPQLVSTYQLVQSNFLC